MAVGEIKKLRCSRQQQKDCTVKVKGNIGIASEVILVDWFGTGNVNYKMLSKDKKNQGGDRYTNSLCYKIHQ